MKFATPLILLLVASCSLSSAEPAKVDPKLKAVFAVSRHERVAVVGIGDSNQLFGGHGYAAAMSKAFYSRFGCYGSGVMQYHQWMDKKENPDPAKAPAEIASKVYSYWYLPAGEKNAVSWRNGQLMIAADHPMGVDGALRFHLTYGRLPETEGSFRPAVRMDAPPWTLLVSASATILSGTGTPYEVVRYTLDLPADPARHCPLQFMPTALPGQVTGPFLAADVNCENLDKKSGIAYSTLYGRGGQSLYNMLATFKECGTERLAEYFGSILETLNGRKTCVIMITSALNDRNERQTSIGPKAGLPSSSPEGYEDNLEGLIQTLTAGWTQAGGDAKNLHFALMPSHALGDPDDTKLVSYRDAARKLAASMPNASFIDLPALVSYKEMVANHYYDKGTETNPHLDKSGYEAIANALVSKLAE